MWNTIFEWKNEPSNEWNTKAQEIGLGSINSFGPFNSALFASSAGHSFMAAYWIPLFLSIFNGYGAEKYKGLKFEHL